MSQLTPITVQYRNRNGMYIVSDPAHSNVVLVGRLWTSVVARAMTLWGIILPKAPPGKTSA